MDIESEDANVRVKLCLWTVPSKTRSVAVVEPVMRYGITQRRYSPRAAVASKKTFSGPNMVVSSRSRVPSQMRIIGRR